MGLYSYLCLMKVKLLYFVNKVPKDGQQLIKIYFLGQEKEFGFGMIRQAEFVKIQSHAWWNKRMIFRLGVTLLEQGNLNWRYIEKDICLEIVLGFSLELLRYLAILEL